MYCFTYLYVVPMIPIVKLAVIADAYSLAVCVDLIIGWSLGIVCILMSTVDLYLLISHFSVFESLEWFLQLPEY